ncbi:MAG: hypothetical protein MHM6MM_005095, partial [Cercozoa sp. M6MM]
MSCSNFLGRGAPVQMNGLADGAWVGVSVSSGDNWVHSDYLTNCRSTKNQDNGDTANEIYLAPASFGTVYGSCQTPVQGLSGQCRQMNECTGATFNKLCPGLPSSVLCCVDETRPVRRAPASVLTKEQFGTLMEGISDDRLTVYHEYFSSAMLQLLQDGSPSEKEACYRIAAFTGQIGHESGGLRYMEELASGSAYEGREDLGNTQPGDGTRFKGRGLIQLTGRSNYDAFHMVDTPERLCFPSDGLRAATWFWMRRGLNEYASTGKQDDYDTITRRINGGTNGSADRNERWQKALTLLDCANRSDAPWGANDDPGRPNAATASQHDLRVSA